METLQRPKTQKEKILDRLREAGAYGVTNFDLNDLAYRYSARIDDLRKDGHDIETVRGKQRSEFRFILHTKPVQARMFEVGV